MFVSETLVGTAVTVPDLRYTTRGVPVANFAVSTSPLGTPPEEAMTWVVKAYASLAGEVMESVSVGESLIVTGSFAASDPFLGGDGRVHTRIECRAQSIAPTLGRPVLDPVFSLRGTVATTPELSGEEDDHEPVVELDVRTSRFKRGNSSEEADVTFWPVSAVGETAVRMADWRVGDSVVVVGEARPLADPPPETPQVEIWAISAGVDLHPQDAHPDAKLARPGRSERKGRGR